MTTNYRAEISTEYIQSILDVLDDGVYITDSNGTTVFINSSYEKISGLSRNKLLGRDIRKLEDEGVFSPIITPSILLSKVPMSEIQTLKNGKCIEINGYPIKGQTGEIKYVVTNVKDITTIKHLNNKIENHVKLNNEYKEKIDVLIRENQFSDKFIFRSQKMKNIVDIAAQISRFDVSVLITGETGVGKEVIAEYIQKESDRAKKPYLTVNCGAIVPSLIESELFGYEGGAFTGAIKSGKPGIFELADGGTLFLDEIGELPIDLQVKLLRVIEQGEVTRVGGTNRKRVHVRIICSTNRDLESLVGSGDFRKDLYYRLNVISIHIPPLRERKEDIEALTLHFCSYFYTKYNIQIALSPSVMHVLDEYEWPGNIRELKNVIERLVILSKDDNIQIESLPDHIRCKVSDVENNRSLSGHMVEVSSGKIIDNLIQIFKLEKMSLKDATGKIEEELISRAISKYGSKRKAAYALKISPATLLRKQR
ncbi:sigma 54-interacting transcriptional regulator [Clostridium sp.]|uniref:sigma-54 interaction domain-containing protein n=1 Tax=Clostridium sp. TaxID=1506 RepID=UPI001A4A21D6|nr:sigma 54-interacting transcriptional regulator [Clostridium sp.]MBK5236304.1 sigma 54-interacting transcriptional regulator [Clostridium sp.]